MLDSFKPIQSIKRAIDVINCFTDNINYLTLKEISEITNLKLSTTRGIANTLLMYGLLNFDYSTKCYSLGLFFSAKSKLLNKKQELYIQYISPFVEKISDEFSVTCCFQIVENLQVYTIYSSSAHKEHYQIHVAEHVLLPLSVSASGKLALAHNYNLQNIKYALDSKPDNTTDYSSTSVEMLEKKLNDILENGYSYENQEYQLGVSSLSVPIFNSNGNIIATLSITSFSTYIESILNDVVPELKNQASQIAKLISNI